MTKPLSGPMASSASGKTDSLVILCHGYGSDGQDLMGLVPHWQKRLPNIAFAAPNGPERCPGSPTGYQWFALTRLAPEEIARGVEMAAPALDQYIETQLDRLKLDASRLVLVGFSQGTMMSLHVGLRRAGAPAGILGFSGLMASPPPADLMSPPPVMMIHGDADDMLPVSQMHLAVRELGEAGVSVQWHVSPGVGHGIDPEGLGTGGRFVQAALSGRLRGAGKSCLRAEF
ncbi:MAG: prolyl oligopeptidase family serine peptidase [Rhizobiales bacterium]|nr:prolyl oligopeptidase family serine peptidase [Hyphomicrobiales bacterium]